MADLVSVIIPNFNYGRYLARTIESVLAQTHRNLEVIVVDDGSSDESLEVLATYADRVQLIRQANGGPGPARARNCGVRHSSGTFIAFLDADDRWDPRKLELQLERFAREPDLGFVHCGEELISDDGRTLGACLEGKEGWIAGDMLLMGQRVLVAPGSSMLLRRATFDGAGGFDPRLTISEDFDLCYRIATQQRVGFVPKPLVQVRIHSASAQRGPAGVRRIERDMLIVFEKIFSTAADPGVRRLRRRALGRLYRVLAGSYLARGAAVDAIARGIRSVWYSPRELLYIGVLPIRRLLRRLRATAPQGTTRSNSKSPSA